MTQLPMALPRAFLRARARRPLPNAHAGRGCRRPDFTSAAGQQRLADLLEDDAARVALIEQLRKVGDKDGAAAPPAETSVTSIAARVADFSRRAAQGAVRETHRAIDSVGDAWTRC